MPPVLPPGLISVGRGQPVARVLAVTVLTVPLVIVSVALIPAFMICPFLGIGRQRLVIHLLTGLCQWTVALTGLSLGEQRQEQGAAEAGQSRQYLRLRDRSRSATSESSL
jgi:hypothetical protein